MFLICWLGSYVHKRKLSKYTVLNNFPLLAVAAWDGGGGGNSGSTGSSGFVVLATLGSELGVHFVSRKKW